MAKRSAETGAVNLLGAKGKKTTFARPTSDDDDEERVPGGLGGADDDDDDDELLQGGSNANLSSEEEDASEEEESDDDDDAPPEETTLASGRAETLASERARAEVESSAKAARRQAAQARALASAAASSSRPAAAAGSSAPYLPESLFASAESDRLTRLAREQAEAERAEARRVAKEAKESERERGGGGEGRELKRRRVGIKSAGRLVGSTHLSLLPPTTSHTNAPSLAPAPEPASVRRFFKRTLQTAQAAGPSAESSGLRSKMRTAPALTKGGGGGKAWSRKSSHLSASQGRVGPALNFGGK